MSLPKPAREVIRAFRDAGLEVEVQIRKKHAMIRHSGSIVYMVSLGSKHSPRQQASLRLVIKRLLSEPEPSTEVE